mmetsp:Transcript_17625/g.32804  ORF Transcript_17625/g.32804 Transcript_17625/m.32804 type:complete len:224 (+) Transcript_17625:786-1457(+)
MKISLQLLLPRQLPLILQRLLLLFDDHLLLYLLLPHFQDFLALFHRFGGAYVDYVVHLLTDIRFSPFPRLNDLLCLPYFRRQRYLKRRLLLLPLLPPGVAPGLHLCLESLLRSDVGVHVQVVLLRLKGLRLYSGGLLSVTAEGDVGGLPRFLLPPFEVLLELLGFEGVGFCLLLGLYPLELLGTPFGLEDLQGLLLLPLLVEVFSLGEADLLEDHALLELDGG